MNRIINPKNVENASICGHNFFAAPNFISIFILAYCRIDPFHKYGKRSSSSRLANGFNYFKHSINFLFFPDAQKKTFFLSQL